jgi:phage shock protein B
MRGISIFFIFLTVVFGFSFLSILVAIALPIVLRATSSTIALGAGVDHRFWVGGPMLPELALVIVFGIGLIGLFALLILLLRRSPRKEEAKIDIDQTRIVQEIYQGLSQMEKRIESLETLLLDRSRNADSLYRD